MENPQNITIGQDNDQTTILKEVKNYDAKKLYIVTENIESKMPSILSYLENMENEIFNKIYVIKYLISMIKNIPYNLELILAIKSKNQNMNLYEVIINEFIYTEKNEKEYIKLLKELITLIFKKLSLNKDIYRYMLSYVGNFLNEKNNNEKNNKNYFNEYNYYQLLELILFFYQSVDDEEPYNYFFFNGENNTNITIKNTESNFLNLDNNLYILLFVKLIDYNYISPLNDNNKNPINDSNIMQIKLKDTKYNINIKYTEIGDSPEIIKNEEAKLTIINIPYNSFNIKETNNVLIKLNSNLKINIYINGKEISLSSELQGYNKNNNIIDSILFFNGFYGICSTIMLYKDDSKSKLSDIFPQFLIDNQNNSSNKTISKYYQNGLYKEELFITFVRADIKNNVDEKNIFDNTIKNLSEQNLQKLKQFIDKNLKSIYIPTRTFILSNLTTKIEGTESKEEETREILLIDSIFNFNAYFKNNKLYDNLSYSRSGGVHCLKNIFQDFSMDIGGINHLLPLIELMTDYNELLTNENLEKFMNIILYLFSNHKKLIANEVNSKFFYYLSLFLEKIPEKFYTDVAVHIKSILLTLESLETENTYNAGNNIFKIYKEEFFNNVCLNEKILFKFNSQEKNLIYSQIYNYLIKESLEQKKININIINIINILLYHEKDKYTHFCCKKHAEYFNKESQIMKPELNEYLKPLINIIKLLLNQFVLEVSENPNEQNLKTRDQLLKLFEILTFDITPCLQISILKLFFDFIQKNDEKYYHCLNKNNNISLITLFVYKTSFFDTKDLAFNYLIKLTNLKSKKDDYLEKYIEEYTNYFYYPKNEENNNEKKFKQKFIMNKINYNLIEYNEKQKELFSYYDKKHFNDLMSKIFERAEYYYKEKICINTNFNILISLASKGDINFIVKLLNLTQDELKKNEINKKNLLIIYNNQKLLQWLLDTCYQAYLLKNAFINREEFTSSFSFGELNNEKEKEQLIDKIISISSDILLNIFYNNIYKLDYVLTWSKYYYEIKEDKNRFLSNRKFIFDYFIQKIIDKFMEKSNKKNNTNISFNYKLYLANIVFEYFSFHKTKGFASGGVLKDLDSLYIQVCSPFIYTLLSEIQRKNKNEEENLYLLNEKWDQYIPIKRLLGDLEFFGLEKEEKQFNDQKNIYNTYIHGKHNMFINELKIYFNNFKNFDYFKNKKKYFCNLGMELILIKYHYYTLLLTVIASHIDLKEILNEMSSFIVLIIVSSTTLSIDNTKHSSNNKIKQNQIWPTEEDYKNIQEMVKIILFNITLFLYERISDATNKMKKYENNLNNSEATNIYENYNLIRIYLINNLFFILKILYAIYTDTRKQEITKKKSDGAIKGLFAKFKNYISSDKEGVQLTGGYLFIKEFLNKCIIESNEQQNENINNTQSSSSNDILNEEKKIFLDDIPNFTLNDIHEKDYEKSSLNKTLENYYSKYIENNEKIKNYFYDFKEKYQRQLFPFVKYILERNRVLGNIIPIYDNSTYTSFDYNYLCLKPNYFPELPKDYINMDNIPKFNKDLVDDIRMYQINIDFNEHDKIRKYRKIKKILFSFNGIFSTKKYFYDKNKYICKYRLLNHMSEDFTRILFTPIIDIDYYLPKFSKFELKNLFRNENKDHLEQITKIVDLSLKNIKNEDNKIEEKIEFSNLNGLYLIKEAEYKNMCELNNKIEGTLSHYLLFKKYIDKKHVVTVSYHNSIENSCFVKTSYHIRGFFYNNNKEIGFYSYDKLPYNYDKKGKKIGTNDPLIDQIQKDYDPDRAACFGSIFSPQIKKYEYLHFKIPYNHIILILKRRYYFKVSALEIFTSDKKSYLFKFEHNKISDIISHLKHYLNQKLEDIYIENNKFYNKIGYLNLSSITNNMNKQIYEKNYMNLKNIYEKWKKWEISNLRFLMYINIYANRSYNDINQYPVFPWIIIDYKSEKFPKINSEDLMRPLNTPMGMLEISEDSKQRREDYLNHWEISKDDDDREDEYDRYGSHYSTSLYVSYYLVRIFPFANIRIELQGTSFDDPNRLFNSMKTSFECSSTQKSDLRELIPELFCLPEILLNNNDFNLGEIKDNSENNVSNSKDVKFKKIEEVETPKWCENNAYYFVKKHRELLESYEISINLNEWINLIFGSKQKGSIANKIKNLYNRQTYEDYEKIFDEMSPEEQDISCRMLEFGVTPHQIFKSDSSQRKINLEQKIKKQLFYNTLENRKQNILNNVEIKNSVIFEEINKVININNAKKIFYFPKDKNSDNIKRNIYIMNNNNIDIYIRKVDKDVIRNDVKAEQMQEFVNPYGGDEIGDDAYEEIAVKILEKKESIRIYHFKYGINNRQPIAWLNKGSILVQGGYLNGNIILKNIVKEKDNTNNTNNINYNEESHRTFIYTTSEYSPIMKIVIDKNETMAICGNTNGTIYIFKISALNKLNWSIYKNINDHNSPISSIAIHENLNMAITCSKDGLCMLYTLPYFQLYNSFIIGKPQKNSKNEEENLCPDIVLISDKPLPCFIFYVDLKRSIYFYSINGELLKKQKLNFSIKEGNIKIYTDYQFVDYLFIYNSRNKTFDLYNMIDFVLIYRSQTLPEGEFIDFILTKEMDHALVLCKIENSQYKLFVLRDSENLISWK